MKYLQYVFWVLGAVFFFVVSVLARALSIETGQAWLEIVAMAAGWACAIVLAIMLYRIFTHSTRY